MKYKSGGKRKKKTDGATRKRKKNRRKFLLPKVIYFNAQAHANASWSCEVARDDRISQLPDDILVPIISELTLKEATATSVLSSRWRHLYTRINSLCLPAFEEPAGEDYIEAQSRKLPDFVNKIDRILDSCQGFRAFYDFRLRFPNLEGRNVDQFERWVEFAFTREARVIDIGIVRYDSFYWEEHFAFSAVSTLITKNGPHLPSFKSLKELHLRNLVVDDREVELVLSNFTLLEHLSIELCRELKNVCVDGNSRLKHLDIFGCWHVVSVRVANMTNLVSLRCGKLERARVLMLENVPNLAKFITTDHHMSVDNDVPLLFGLQSSSVLGQLSHLQLLLHPLHLQRKWQVGRELYVVPKLMNVKHLKLHASICVLSAFYLYPFIEAFPLLEKLEITFKWCDVLKFKKREPYRRRRTKPPNEHLRQVWLSGFLGCPHELGFVLYIIDSAVALEELIVEAFGAKARARAWRHLRPATPSSVNFIII